MQRALFLRGSSSVAIALLLAAVPNASLLAQLRADPGTVINGRVAVRVNVTLSDDDTPYAPIGGVQLRFFRTTADTTVTIRTDDAGSATALLLPGEYRLMSSSPVDWKGWRYSWNQLVQVRAGLPTVELKSTSALRAEITDVPPPTPPRADSVDSDGRLVMKDPGMATLYSFFAPGTGHIYAGETGKGWTMLGLSVVGVVVSANAISCATDNACDQTTGGLTLGAAGMLAFFGSWAYGMFDAADAARRANLRHGFTTANIRPLVAPTIGGRTRLGFAVPLPR